MQFYLTRAKAIILLGVNHILITFAEFQAAHIVKFIKEWFITGGGFYLPESSLISSKVYTECQ